MKNLIFTIVCISIFSINLMGQERKESIELKKTVEQESKESNAFLDGVLYHIAVENRMLPTTEINKTIKEFAGKIKLIIQSEKAKNKAYKIPEKILKKLDTFESFSSYPKKLSCKCLHGWITIYIYCTNKNCEDCCRFVREDTEVEDWILLW